MAQIQCICTCWAKFFAEMPVEGLCWASFFAPTGAASRSCRRCGALQGGCGGGFCAMRSPLTACRRRVGALDGVIPPFAGGGATSRGGVAAKLQTHWGKRVQKRLFWLNGSAIWRSWWVWTHRLRYSALQARRMRVGSVSWAPRLAPLTRSCAAKPHWWHGGQPAQAATYWVSVRGKEPRPPPIGLMCV